METTLGSSVSNICFREVPDKAAVMEGSLRFPLSLRPRWDQRCYMTLLAGNKIP